MPNRLPKPPLSLSANRSITLIPLMTTSCDDRLWHLPPTIRSGGRRGPSAPDLRLRLRIEQRCRDFVLPKWIPLAVLAAVVAEGGEGRISSLGSWLDRELDQEGAPSAPARDRLAPALALLAERVEDWVGVARRIQLPAGRVLPGRAAVCATRRHCRSSTTRRPPGPARRHSGPGPTGWRTLEWRRWSTGGFPRDRSSCSRASAPARLVAIRPPTGHLAGQLDNSAAISWRSITAIAGPESQLELFGRGQPGSGRPGRPTDRRRSRDACRPTVWVPNSTADLIEWTFRLGPAQITRTAVVAPGPSLALIGRSSGTGPGDHGRDAAGASRTRSTAESRGPGLVLSATARGRASARVFRSACRDCRARRTGGSVR